MKKYDKHAVICDELNNIYRVKNEAYGDAFGKTFKDMGIMSAVVRMQDKFNRIKALVKGASNEVIDESIEDTLRDLANYCIMTLIELEGTNECN